MAVFIYIRSIFRTMGKEEELMRNRTAIYAGSFDILTFGHLYMISRGAQLFDKLFVALGTNPDKQYLFTEEERFEMLEMCCSGKEIYDSSEDREMSVLWEEEAAKVEAVNMGNRYLVDFADDMVARGAEKDIRADWYLRGIRSHEDYANEKTMAEVNKNLLPGCLASPVWIPADPKFSTVSSSLVRGLIGPEGWEWAISQFVPGPVWEKLLEKFDGKDIFKSDRIANGDEDEEE